MEAEKSVYFYLRYSNHCNSVNYCNICDIISRPVLRSLDLSHNDLVRLDETVYALHSLPMLRNVLLVGNPLSVS